jgi:hypothetical protein
MAAKTEKPDPSVASSAYEFMRPKWDMIETLLGGTAAMREAGLAYLPQHSAEHDGDYQNRLHQTTLYNVTDLTLNSLVGRVFREEMKLNEDVPETIKTICLNVDSKGTNVSSFAQKWFRESMAKGFGHVLIDMPVMTEEEKAARTKADDIKDGRRPYWSLIKPESMIFMYWEEVNGVDSLAHARIMETYCELVDFTEVIRTQIRVLEVGLWEIWRNANEGQDKKKPDWQMVNNGMMALDQIPIVTFYTNQTGPMMSKPPLEDLGYMNIRHWQSTSDQINVLTVARFPMLAASGTQVEKGKSSLPIGPRQLLTMRDPNGRFYYVEHTGKAISAGQSDLEELEDRMASYGAEFLRRQVAGRTAFERAQDTNEAISPLKDMAIRFQEAMALALDITADWLNLEGPENAGEVEVAHAGGTVTINTKFTEEDQSDAAMKALGEARKRGDVSRKTFITEMVRRGIIDQTTSVDAEITQILKEFKEGPHPPTYFSGQEQIQGKAPDATTIDAATAGGDGNNPGVKPPKGKT